MKQLTPEQQQMVLARAQQEANQQVMQSKSADQHRSFFFSVILNFIRYYYAS